MRYAIILCFLLVLCLVIPFQSSAESWVLWQKTELVEIANRDVKTNLDWEIVSAYEKYGPCEQAQVRVWKSINKRAQDDKLKYHHTIEKVDSVSPSLVMTTYNSGSFLSQNLYCLPGTLDPRK